MLRSLNTVLGSTIHAKDGELGHVHDGLFDDRAWAIRYLVVETGSWLSSRRVLLAPSVAGRPDWDKRVLPVELTMDQVRHSPDVDIAKPVSRQQEIAMSQHYGWLSYWAAEPPFFPQPVLEPAAPIPEEGDPHLRSVKEVCAYDVKATDGDLGRVNDMIMEDANWVIRFMAVSTGSWFSGQKLLLPTRLVGSISWSHRHVLLAQSRDEL